MNNTSSLHPLDKGRILNLFQYLIKPGSYMLHLLTNRINVFILSCATVAFMAGCANTPYYEEFVSKEKETWNVNEPAGFPVQIRDAEAAYDLIFTFRNTTDYAYSNLYVFLTTIHPDQTARRDTLEFLLADRYGRWLGKGFGKIRESSFLVREHLHFPDTGNFVFILEQAMRDETLKGITDVGIRLEKKETMK